MRERCSCPRYQGYDRYGGRGISVCERWQGSFEAFLDDAGAAPSRSHSLGRLDNDGNYEPGNVRMADGDRTGEKSGEAEGKNTKIGSQTHRYFR